MGYEIKTQEIRLVNEIFFYLKLNGGDGCVWLLFIWKFALLLATVTCTESKAWTTYQGLALLKGKGVTQIMVSLTFLILFFP